MVREATRAVAKATVAAAAAKAAKAAVERGMGNASEVVDSNSGFAAGGVGGGAGDGEYQVQQHHQYQQQYYGEGGLGAGGNGGGGGGGGRREIPVRSDGNDIPQSRAVETVRDTLGTGGVFAGGARVGTGILSSSPGRGGGIGGERERRKSVKFVATDERR